MIDQLSHGRFMPGVGRGVRDPEHELFGSDTRTDAGGLRRSAGDPATGAEHRPHHASRQAIPVRRRAGAFRDGAEAVSTLLVCRQSAARGRAGNERARPGDHANRSSSTGRSGRRGARETILVSWATIRWSARRATSSLPRAMRRQWRSRAAHSVPMPSTSIAPIRGSRPDCRIPPHCRCRAAPTSMTMREAGQVLAGSPSRQCAMRCGAIVAAVGPKHNYLCGAFQWGDLTTEEARRSLDLFAAEVRPALS